MKSQSRIGGLVAVAAITLAGCGGEYEIEPLVHPRYDDERQAYIFERTTGDLHQTVEVSSLAPERGDTLHVRSIVVNRGAPREVESLTCRLDLRGVQLEYYLAYCAGYSMRAELAAGDSLVAYESGIVREEPGTYRLRVRHLLDPEQWVEVEVDVS